ncbi:TetR/AcrR family transcriptional regulator [Mucisphaera sp.]|uniref:TetR/AcrR family transcriptional regulator n=1 Tax=Mucisphaera sp. TaxID=2913024 RepID=UPI003D1289BB
MAALKIARTEGMRGASVRSITREAGVTEAALYRHFKSKDDLWREIYTRIVQEMIREKADLLTSDAPLERKIYQWVDLTYAYYDGNRDAFTYVLLMPDRYADSLGEVYTAQSRMLRELLMEGVRAGDCRGLDPDLAVATVSGMLLNVPRLINEGLLKGPAVGYSDDVSRAIWRVLAPWG